MGISFQIKDDLLGLFGNETVIGKNGDADIAEGKKSLLVSRFDNVATADQKRIFYGIYGIGESWMDGVFCRMWNNLYYPCH